MKNLLDRGIALLLFPVVVIGFIGTLLHAGYLAGEDLALRFGEWLDS